jgi:regulator of sigma E protease
LDVLITSILPFAGILLALMVVHEAGHYFTAKLFGIKVLEAGIGFPPKAFGFTWRGTIYSIIWLPLGAFVRLLGEEDPTDPDSLAARPKWQRTIVIASGAFLNLVLAIALFTTGLMIPRTVSEGGAVILDVIPNSPAAEAGLQPGDQIVEVNGRKAESTQDASYLIRLYQGSNIDFLVKRTDPRTGTETVNVDDVHARWNPHPYDDECGVKQPQGPTGITIGTRHGQTFPYTAEEKAKLEKSARSAVQEYRKDVKPDAAASCTDGRNFGFVPLSAAQCADLTPDQLADAQALKADVFPDSSAACYRFDPGQNFAAFTRSRSEPIWEALPHGTRLSFESLILARNQVWTWIRGYANPQLTGPVGIAQATGEVVDEAGWKSLIDFAALLSMNLAILNILPIPMFDGGRLVFIFIEFIRRGKRVSPEKEALVHLTGLVFIISLAVVITYFDIARIFRGDSLLQ